MERWFSDAELREMATPVIKRIKNAIKKGEREQALSLCDVLRDERIIFHDFQADACTALYTWIGRSLGEETLRDMFIFSFDQSARRQIIDLLALDIPPGLEAMMLCRGGWVSHSCSGAGQHGGAFQLLEDDEKFTFVMDPCGSGARLWRKGRYEPPADFAMTSEVHAWSYGREGFPYYCVHCAFLNELVPFQHLGFISWPVDPPANADEPCRWYIYKDKSALPASYYERFGLTPRLTTSRKPGSKAWFTEEWLRENVRYTPDRIRERLEQGEDKAALSLCGKMGGEFFFLHNLYVNMLVTTLDFILRNAGEQKLGEALAYVYEKCIAGPAQIVSLVEDQPRAEQLRQVIHNMFLADLSGGAGMPSASFRISETENEVRISLNPCGSGGKLIRHQAYKPIDAFRKGREKIENTMLGISLKLPLPRALMEFMMPFVLDYISETRKPENIGIVLEGHDWTTNRKGLPLYCSFCTAFMNNAAIDWLSVEPPTTAGAACVWRARKSS